LKYQWNKSTVLSNGLTGGLQRCVECWCSKECN